MSPTGTADELLAALDPLPYPRRLERVARTANTLARTGELPSLLAELDGRGRYERRLAALAALTGGQTAFLAERLADRDEVVSGYALRGARTLPVPDAAIEAAYEDASARTRTRLARAVLAGGRTELAERLVVRLREQWGDCEAARLLPACSAEFTARLLPELAYAVGKWTGLARRHPGLVMDHAERALADEPRHLRDAWWQQHAYGIALIAPVRPGRVLGLLESHGPGTLPWPLREQLGALVAYDAERTVRWLISPGRDQPRHEPLPAPGVLRRLARADPPSLPELGRLWLRRSGHFSALLRAMPPGRRGEFFDAVTAGSEAGRERVDAILALLPRERRWAEARRLVPWGRAEGWTWHDVLDTLAHGPFDEAWPELLAALKRPDADERALVWPLLAVAARHAGDRAAMTQLLDVMRRLRNEQDPVRSAALDALAGLPPGLFRAEDADALDRILLDALDARDTSAAGRTSLRRLAVSLLAANAGEEDGDHVLLKWALRALERITGYVGVTGFGPLRRTLRRGQEHQVFAALRPWLEAACDKADHRLLFDLADALGDRAHRVPELQRMLEEALARGGNGHFETAARLWLADPRTRDERAGRILSLEPSAAVLAPVQAVLTRTRTDLLDLLIGEEAPYGRFLAAGSRRPLPSGLGDAHRWLPRQQEAVLRLAVSAAEDPSRPLLDRAAAIRAAAPLPGHGRELALRWADSDEVVLAEAALGALPWTDDPGDTLPVLLAHAGGDRARVAVYAATRAARFAAPSELGARLGALLASTHGTKVTSRKEAVRLAARFLPPRRAAALVAAAYHAPGQHPDVQAAVVSFAAGLVSEEDTWTVLADAPHAAPPVRHALLRTEPRELPDAHRPRYARLVGEACGSADPEVAMAGLWALPQWARYAPESVATLSRAVTDLGGTRATWRNAARMLITLAASGLPHPVGGAAAGSLLHDTVAELLVAVRLAEHEALPDRDLPARQRLTTLLATLSYQPPQEAGPLLEAVASQLAGEPSLLAARTDLMRPLVDPGTGPSVFAARLRSLADALSGRPVLAATTAERLRSDLANRRPPGDPDALQAVARRFATEGDTVTGLLAVAVTAGMGGRLGWPEPWRLLLRSLRRHDDADVREAAYAVTVHSE